MPRLSIEVLHQLGQDEATRRLKEKFAAALAEHRGRVKDFQEQWQDHTVSFSFGTMGVKISGSMAIEPQSVNLALKLPLIALPFRGAIEERLRHEIAALLR